jgi:hypothetical protein
MKPSLARPGGAMKFPGSKLLHQVDLSNQGVSLSDVLRSCQQVSLTGFAEVRSGDAMGMIFYYLGGEVNALFREGQVARNGQAAIDALKAVTPDQDTNVAVYELPLDMAHLLRGITQRRRLRETLASAHDLETLLERLREAPHTGTLEIQTPSGNGILLLVQGRVSNCYWETPEGLTFEKGEARRRLDRAVTAGDSQLLLSDFSRDIWKARHEIQAGVRSRLDKRPAEAPVGTDQLTSEEKTSRRQLLDDLHSEVPALLCGLVFDLMTGAILERKFRGSDALKVGLLADKLPSFVLFLRDLVSAQDKDQMESVDLSTLRVQCVVAVVPETQEGVGVLADKSQPTALIASALGRCIRTYVQQARPQRGGGVRV